MKLGLSVTGKLIAIIVLITATCLGAGFAFVIFNDVRTFKRDMVHNTVLIASVVAEYSVPDLVFEDRKAAAETLDKLAKVPSIEQVTLYGTGGDVFATWGDDPPLPAPAPGEPPVRFADGALHVVQPVIYEGETYGSLHLRCSTAELQAKIARHALVMGTVLTILLGVGLVSAASLQRIISAPILRLTNTTRKVTETGDYSIRASKTADDEIGQLCDSFNQMLDQIHRREVERDQAELRTREKSQFLAAMSHELRTPLNAIIGFADVLVSRMSESLPPRGMRFLGYIRSSGHHLLGIINDILDLSKVEAGKMTLALEWIDLATVVDGVAAVMKGAVEKRSITIQIDVPADLPPVLADPIKLKQVLYNLLSNAVKFSADASIVYLAARQIPSRDSPLGTDSIEISVSDRGIGIPDDQLDQVFEPFMQADGGASRRFGGTGLGLSLVKTFVLLHRGTVTVSSTVDKGSTFTVLLPREGSPASEPAADKPPVDGVRVLVVEPDPVLVEHLRKDLAAATYQTLVARSQRSALRQIRTRRPAVLMIGLDPPRLGGWQTLNHLKRSARAASLPVVVYAQDEGSAGGVAVGADDYFEAPTGIGRLVTRLGQLAPPAGAPARTVLIISGDEQLRRKITSGLFKHGFQVEQAIAAEDAVERASGAPANYIVLDLMTQNMAGIEIALRLRQHPNTVNVPCFLLGRTELLEPERAALTRSLDTLARRFAHAGPISPIVHALLDRHNTMNDNRE